jgi:hypothetical protein
MMDKENRATWRKSTYSGSQSNCVEVAGTLDRVRDSKNPTGPTIRADISALVTAVKAGQFDR